MVINISTDPAAGLAGSVFPVASNWVEIMTPSSAPDVCLSSLVPSIVGIGLDQVSLVNTNISIPANMGQSSCEMVSFELALTDKFGIQLDPSRLFDRIGFSIDDGSITYSNSILALTGLLL